MKLLRGVLFVCGDVFLLEPIVGSSLGVCDWSLTLSLSVSLFESLAREGLYRQSLLKMRKRETQR